MKKDQLSDNSLNKQIFETEERKKYIADRHNYIQGVEGLKPVHKNRVDDALLPFRKALGDIVKIGAKFILTNDTVTGVYRRITGERAGDGRFNDSVDGISGGKTIVLSNWTLNEPDNAVAHEFNHALLQNIMDREDSRKIKQLYDNAKKDKKFLDFYSARNEWEYFAQGYMNYVAPSLPHKFMANKGDYYAGINTKLSVKQKDPDLYNFIEHCIKKYGIQDKVKLDKVA